MRKWWPILGCFRANKEISYDSTQPTTTGEPNGPTTSDKGFFLMIAIGFLICWIKRCTMNNWTRVIDTLDHANLAFPPFFFLVFWKGVHTILGVLLLLLLLLVDLACMLENLPCMRWSLMIEGKGTN